MTPVIRSRIDTVLARLEKFAGKTDPDAVTCAIEVGTITKHHRKGKVYRAEINVFVGRKSIRATAAGESVIAALHEAQEEIERRLLKAKKKAVSVKHREGVAMKRMRRGARE